MSHKHSQVKDHLIRVPGSTPYGSALWYLGRAADAPFQYILFSRGFAVSAVNSLGLRASNVLVKAGPGIGGLGPVPTLLTAMYAVAALRQGYWLAFTNTYAFPLSQSLNIVLYNLFADSFNTLSAAHALACSPRPTVLGWKQWAGIAMFATGLLIETLAESSRKRFKKDPKNKGKIDDTGLWSIVRHPNYMGYTLWRSGITLATGSMGVTLGLAIFQITIFIRQSIPGLSGHMEERYGGQWKAYESRVPYKLFPGII